MKRIEFNAIDSRRAELRIYGELADVDAKTFAAKLDRLGEIDELTIRINSPGGDVFSGLAIYNLLRRHPAKKTVYIDGVAASAASMIAMAGDVIIMPPSAVMMIHNPQADGVYGDVARLRSAADALEEVRKSMITVYCERTKLSVKEIEEMIASETWMTASRAVELGFADKIDEKVAVKITAKGGSVMLNGVKIDSERLKKMLAELDEDDQAAVGELIEELAEEKADEVVEEGGTVELAPEDTQAVEDLVKDLVQEKVEEILEEEDELPEEGEAVVVARERRRVLALLALEKKVPGSGAIIRAAIRSGKQPPEVSMSLLLDDSVRRTTALGARHLGAVKYQPTSGRIPNKREKAVAAMVAHLKKIKGVK